MTTTQRAVIISSLAAVFGFSTVLGQESNVRAVEQFLCKDIMRDNGPDREVAIAFLHGFMLGKSGKSTFDRDDLLKQSREFIERCLDSPQLRAIDVMAKVKGNS